MPDYTSNEIVDIILVLGECHNNYRQAAVLHTVIDFLIDDIQIIVWFPGLYCANDNVNVKNDKNVVLTYQKEMIQQYLPYWKW